jgi:hypothetical protein
MLCNHAPPPSAGPRQLSVSCVPTFPVPEHLASAKMNSLHNFWYYVFDFTPKEGSWKLLPPTDSTLMSNTEHLLSPIPPSIATHLGQGTPEVGARAETLCQT